MLKLLLGASGSGKTFLACALGNAACRKYKSVRYIRLPELLEELSLAQASGELKKLIKSYRKYDLLILDEWLIRCLTPQESYNLLEIVEMRSGQGAITRARSMSGGNQQKAIIAREIDKDPKLLVAVQPTRGLDVGAIEYIHRQIVAERDKGKAVLLVSLELDEVMNLSDRILVMYEGQIVGELDPKQTTVQELGLYMSGAKRSGKDGESA